MQKEVLRFVHPDYEVIVRTQDISYSWKQFEGRINHTRNTNPELVEPDKYCRYTSKDSCKLCLYNPDDKVVVKFPESKEWDNLWPVIFETCKYQVRLLFHGLDKESTPVRDKDLPRIVPIAYSFQCALAEPRAYSRRNSMQPMPHRDS